MNRAQLGYLITLLVLTLFLIYEPLLVIVMAVVVLLTGAALVITAVLYGIYRELGD